MKHYKTEDLLNPIMNKFIFYLYFIDFIQVSQTLETVQKEKIKSR